MSSARSWRPDSPTRRKSAALGAVDGLAFAASPTFALMAWIAAGTVSAIPLCSSGPSVLPIDGMTAMYLLMSVFHLPPWLTLARPRP
jgi:uncharacterized RDD family membrane protein YckC